MSNNKLTVVDREGTTHDLEWEPGQTLMEALRDTTFPSWLPAAGPPPDQRATYSSRTRSSTPWGSAVRMRLNCWSKPRVIGSVGLAALLPAGLHQGPRRGPSPSRWPPKSSAVAVAAGSWLCRRVRHRDPHGADIRCGLSSGRRLGIGHVQERQPGEPGIGLHDRLVQHQARQGPVAAGGQVLDGLAAEDAAAWSATSSTSSSAWLARRRANRCWDWPPAAVRDCTYLDPVLDASTAPSCATATA